MIAIIIAKFKEKITAFNTIAIENNKNKRVLQVENVLQLRKALRFELLTGAFVVVFGT